MTGTISRRSAELYDAIVADWPGEIDFYLELAVETRDRGLPVLEVGCGTGRIALRLAAAGVTVAGFDLSPEMLAVAQGKSSGVTNIRWIEADMRAFDLGETFGLVIVPGHAFQNLNIVEDQLAALACIRRHLADGGLLVIHLDHQEPGWLGEISGDKRGVMEPAGEVQDPATGHLIRTQRAWSYERASQTATTWSVSEEVDSADRVLSRWESGPTALHCIFRFEMEHLLARSGFRVEALYGDFFRGSLTEGSSEMIWLARGP